MATPLSLEKIAGVKTKLLLAKHSKSGKPIIPNTPDFTRPVQRVLQNIQQCCVDTTCLKCKKNTCKMAVTYGHLDCLKIAHHYKCFWDEDTCATAAMYGQYKCLKFAHENGCPWDILTCFNAAAFGYLNVLKYAHKNGCPWDETVCEAAIEGEHEECLEYLVKHGCPCPIMDTSPKQNLNWDLV